MAASANLTIRPEIKIEITIENSLPEFDFTGGVDAPFSYPSGTTYEEIKTAVDAFMADLAEFYGVTSA